MKLRITTIALLLACSLGSMAQVEGTVVNRKLKPQRNLSVWLKGQKGPEAKTRTGRDGTFKLGNVKAGDTLCIAASGKYTAEVPAKGLSKFTVRLEKDLFHVVSGSADSVYAYTLVQRRAPSNVITRDEIAQMNANSLYDILRSSVSGVTVSEGFNGSTVTIRGGSSFESGNEPIFVIDGTEYDSSDEANRQVNVNDIDKIEIDKAGSQYGARGANGAIIITTRNK